MIDNVTKSRFEQIRIENTNRCTYHCFFCPHEKLSRARGLMSLDDFRFVLQRIGYHEGRIDLHGFGEPLLDPLLWRKIELVTAYWPHASPYIYTTLGVPLENTAIHKLVRSGLHCMQVSLYGVDRSSYQAAHGVDRFEMVCHNLQQILRVRAQENSNLNIEVRAFPDHERVKQPLATESAVERFHAWLKEIGVNGIRKRSLHNYGTGRRYNRKKTSGRCSVIGGFRSRVLQITWNLKVIPCCFDFNAEMCLGDLREQSLDEIFQSSPFLEFIQAHQTGHLALHPVCAACEQCQLA